jgi:hypothetical protein
MNTGHSAFSFSRINELLEHLKSMCDPFLGKPESFCERNRETAQKIPKIMNFSVNSIGMNTLSVEERGW